MLPQSLPEALDALEADTELREVLGDFFVESFLTYKRNEVDRFAQSRDRLGVPRVRLPPVSADGGGPASRPLSLGDERVAALDHGVALLREAWQSFDDARPHQPPVSLETMGLLESALPEDGIGVRAALDAAGQVLDESLAQTRPRFFGYVGSSGLESAVLADAMAMSHDVNLAAESAAALLVEQQTHRLGGPPDRLPRRRRARSPAAACSPTSPP